MKTKNKIIIGIVIGVVIILAISLYGYDCVNSGIGVNGSYEKFRSGHGDAFDGIMAEYDELLISGSITGWEDECVDVCEEGYYMCEIGCEAGVCDGWDECEEDCDYIDCNLYYTGHDACGDENLECRLDCELEIYPDGIFTLDDCNDYCSDEYNICVEENEDENYPICMNCYNECDDLYNEPCNVCYENCFNEAWGCIEPCVIYADDEIYEWDRTRIDDIGEFFTNSFPAFDEEFRDECYPMFWFILDEDEYAVFVSNEDMYGCANMGWGMYDIHCDDRGMLDFKEVCEEIGYTFTCDLGGVTCHE